MRALVTILLLTSATASAQRIVRPAEGLSEVSRDIEVELRYGLALVTTRITLTNIGTAPREALLRVPVPAGAGLVALRVCSAGVCRDGAPDVGGRSYDAAYGGIHFSPRPFAIASMVDWTRRFIVARAAPVLNTHPMSVTVRYVATTSLREGTISFALPAQGGTARDGPINVSLSAPGLESATVDGRLGRVTVASDADAQIRARMPVGVARAYGWSVRCGADRCTRFRVAAGPVPVQPRDVFLLLDASPSAREIPPTHRAAVLAELLAGVHPQSRVVRVAFGRRAARLDPEPLAPAAVPVAEPLDYLGNRTSFDEAWALIRPDLASAVDPLVVLIGDGALAADAATRAALDELTHSGAELSLVSLARRDVFAPLADAIRQTGGTSVITLDARPDDRVRLVATPLVESDVRINGRSHGTLRAGEELIVETRRGGGGATPGLRALGRVIPPSVPRQLYRDGLAARLGVGGWQGELVAASLDQREAATTGRRAARGGGFLPSPRRLYGRRPSIRASSCHGIFGSPSRAVLHRLRSGLRPAVTACFRAARAGRPTWSAHATLRLVMEYGELLSATVPQSTDPRLRACLSQVADEYGDIPFGEFPIAANFSFRSVPVEVPPTETPSRALRRALMDIGIR